MVDASLESLGERIAEQAAHLDAARYRLLSDVREFDARGGWTHQGARSCAHWLSWRVGWDPVTARDHVRVAHKLADLPETSDALRRGELSYSKVRAITRVATAATEHLLVEYARLTTGAQLERICRQFHTVMRHGEATLCDDPDRRYVRRRDQPDGMVRIEAVLHPDEAELVWTMLTDAAKRQRVAAVPAQPPPTAVVDTADAAAAPELAAAMRVRNPVAPRPVAAASADSAEAPVMRVEPCAPPTVGAMVRVDSAHVARTDSEHLAAGSDSAEAFARAAGEAAFGAGPANAAVVSASMEAFATVAGDFAEALRAAAIVDTSAESRTVAADPAEAPRPAASMIERLPALDPSEFPPPSKPQPGDREAAAYAVQCYLQGPIAEPAEEPSLPRGELVSVAPAPRASATAPAERPVSQPAPCTFSPNGFDRADALVALAQAYLRGDRPERAPVDVIVTIPLATLQDRAAGPIDAGWLGETAVTGDLARRLSCDAGVTEVIEDEHGKPLTASRKQRTISGSLKRALLSRDGGCAFPGCTNRVYLEGHHIQHWITGGETSLDNSALLCSHHHRYVHEYNFTVALDATGHPQFFDPRGRRIERAPAAALRGPSIAERNAGLAISAETAACGWSGCHVPYRTIIGCLVRATG